MLTRGKIEDVAEKAGQVVVVARGVGAVLVHVGTNNAEEGTSAIIGKYRRLVKTLRGTDWTDCVVWRE